MDTLDLEPTNDLSYDDTVPYQEQVPVNDAPQLASRIGSTKVYLLSEASRKRKRTEDTDETDEPDEDIEMDEDLPYRANAILLSGSPISHLPTSRLFAYVTHFDVLPLALEWVDDETCVFVFETRDRARTGFQLLRKSIDEEEDTDGFITAKPIPQALWPPEERINQSLGKGQGLKGIVKMRWARKEDVKKRGAKSQSKFYQKHGIMAGKEHLDGRDSKRRRGNGADLAARLDVELDEFVAEGEAGPPSKMRSDYFADDGRTVLEHNSMPDDLQSRIAAPLPRRNRNKRMPHRRRPDERRRNGGGGDGRRSDRPQKTQQELDDELDAFLNEATVE